MNEISKNIILFIVTYLIFYLLYYVFVIRKEKKKLKLLSQKKGAKLDIAKVPVEVNYLIIKYRIDFKKIDYNKLLHIIAFVCSFDLSLIVTIVILVDGIIFQVLLSTILCLPIIYISFMLIGKYYKKKGMTLDV